MNKIEKENTEFFNWITELKSKIHSANTKAALTINSQLLELYWEIGKDISERQSNSNWGSKFIEQTAIELRKKFPNIKGFSRRNLYAIKQWYSFYAEKYDFVPQLVA
jgi:predicted nuclease of restriction endonuclease-like (RecB) superfamily